MRNVIFKTINGLLDQVNDDGVLTVAKSNKQLADFNAILKINNNYENSWR